MDGVEEVGEFKDNEVRRGVYSRVRRRARRDFSLRPHGRDLRQGVRGPWGAGDPAC